MACANRASPELDRTLLAIPAVASTSQRPVTVEDLAALRHIDTLSVSGDGRRYAIFVRQADPAANDFRTGWFVGSTEGGGLVRLGDGGQARPTVMYTGHIPGKVAGSESRWSPDGAWIAFTLRQGDQVQLWRSRADGGVHEPVTHNAADVRDFAWSADGRALYFTVGPPRNEQLADEQRRAWQGYRYDEDLWLFTDFMAPRMIRPLPTDLTVWVVNPDTHEEQPASESERAAFEKIVAQRSDRVSRASGASARLVRANPASQVARVTVSRGAADADVTTCPAKECSGVINEVWWSADGSRVLFWRSEGLNDAEHGFYAWAPGSESVTTIARLRDDDLRLCGPAVGDRLICVRETAAHPPHLAAVDIGTGNVTVVADVNPEFRNIRLGNVERFEWDTPKFRWNEPGGALAGLYAKRAYGYIIYPPDFDPARKYPVFIDPYVAKGFSPLGSEHALHAYAANGILVLRTAFPLPIDRSSRGGAAGMKQLYSAELGFPHLTMLMEATLRGLDAVAARGFIDERRVGIGGVSHGTFVPLYMLQKHDRITALSMSSPTWGPFQYYGGTRKARSFFSARKEFANDDWVRKPEGEGRAFHSKIDIADHIEAIEAPILMHLAAQETWALVRLIRHLADAGSPYDAYVFRDETHIKWQPAHLRSIMKRNLDWFRFWLQDVEDAAPEAPDQYERWRQLRELQCQNRRSLRNYCPGAVEKSGS